MLRTIGRPLLSLAGYGVCAGRFGGDGFALLLRARALHAAQEPAERRRGMVAGSRMRGGTDEPIRGRVTISVGDAPHNDSVDALQWLQRADAALYEARRKGRDPVVSAPA